MPVIGRRTNLPPEVEALLAQIFSPGVGTNIQGGALKAAPKGYAAMKNAVDRFAGWRRGQLNATMPEMTDELANVFAQRMNPNAVQEAVQAGSRATPSLGGIGAALHPPATPASPGGLGSFGASLRGTGGGSVAPSAATSPSSGLLTRLAQVVRRNPGRTLGAGGLASLVGYGLTGDETPSDAPMSPEPRMMPSHGGELRMMPTHDGMPRRRTPSLQSLVKKPVTNFADINHMEGMAPPERELEMLPESNPMQGIGEFNPSDIMGYSGPDEMLKKAAQKKRNPILQAIISAGKFLGS